MSNWGRIGVFDLETTGVDVDTSRIVSACIAILDESGDVLARWDWLADPGIEIPEGAARVHGITTERARAEGRPSAMVVAEIAQTLRLLFGLGIPVVVYNAPYDLSLLDRECRRNDLLPVERPFPVVDPLVLDKAVDRFRKGKRTLEVTAELYGVDLDDAHDAGSDAIAAGRVALALARAYPEELAISADDLHGRQEIWYREQAESFQQYIRTTKGDANYVANAEWPLRAATNPQAFVDTQPIPAPEPRPSLTVPVLDLYGTGVLSLESLASAPTSAYATAPPPTLIPRQQVSSPAVTIAPARRPTVLRVAAGIVTDGDGRTLVVRKRGTSMFMQAGGKIEPGESALDALTRELLEEIGLVLDPDTTEYLGSFRAEEANEPDTVIRAEIFAVVAHGTLVASGEIEELRWLESLETAGVDLAPLTRDTVLPLWVERRSALF